MRRWRRASERLDCGGPEPHCRIEAGAPYQRVELALGIIKYRCEEHATEPVNQAQLDAFDAQQAAGNIAPARHFPTYGRCLSFCSVGERPPSIDQSARWRGPGSLASSLPIRATFRRKAVGVM